MLVANSPEVEQLRTLKRATLKLVVLLATQVATQGEIGEAPRSGDLPPPLMPITLKKQASGSGTFTDSVFHLLFQELEAALTFFQQQQLKENVDKNKGESASERERKKSKSDRSKRRSSTSRSRDKEKDKETETLDEILNLLISISATGLCQRFLTTSAWISLLLALLVQGPCDVQWKTFDLLEHLVPLCDPESTALNLQIPDLVGPGTHPGVGSDLVDFLLSTIAIAMVPTATSLGMANSLASPLGSPTNSATAGDNSSGRSSFSAAAASPADDGSLASVDSLFWLTNVSVALLRRLLRSKLWTATTSMSLQRAVAAMKDESAGNSAEEVRASLGYGYGELDTDGTRDSVRKCLDKLPAQNSPALPIFPLPLLLPSAHL
jgi:hypothetical protein